MNYAAISSCRHGPTGVCRIGDVHYYGSSQSGAMDFKGELMINFTRTSDIPSVMDIPELAKFVDIPFKEIMVPWPDFGMPSVNIGFWPALHKYIVDNDMSQVCFHCQAGHGRTGTALCAMLIAVEGLSVYDAIDFVRSIYCEQAVESHEQVEYLCMLDEVYNGRHLDEDDYPVSSMMIMMQRREEEKAKGLHKKKLNR